MKKDRIGRGHCFVPLRFALEDPAYKRDIPRLEETIDKTEVYREFIKRNRGDR